MRKICDIKRDYFVIVFIFHAFRLKVFLLFNSVVSFLSIAREARVDLRSPAPENAEVLQVRGEILVHYKYPLILLVVLYVR